MTQSSARRCPQCKTLVPSDQSYCHQCGSLVEVHANAPTVMSRTLSSMQMPPVPSDPYSDPTQIAPWRMSTVPSDPYSKPIQGAPVPSDPYSASTPVASSLAGVSQQPAANSSLPLQAALIPPLQRRAVRSLKRVGCALGITFVLLLALFSGVGYFLMHSISSQSTSGGGSNFDAIPTQSPMITTPLGETITYSSVIITLVNAQQASRFADDNSTTSGGALRLNIHENQAAPLDTGGSTTDPYYGYDKTFNLVLPGGKVIDYAGIKTSSGPTGKASQDNWLDFSVSTAIKVNQLTLRLGSTNEAQMDVPLVAHANLSIYQPQVAHLTTRVPYGDTFWTLTTASKQWSNGGKQAGQGQRFLVLAVSVDNPSSSDVNAFPPDYVRLQVGGNQLAEANDNLPTGFAAGTTGSKGLLAFLVPQDSTSFSLVLLGNGTAHASNQATLSFTLP